MSVWVISSISANAPTRRIVQHFIRIAIILILFITHTSSHSRSHIRYILQITTGTRKQHNTRPMHSQSLHLSRHIMQLTRISPLWQRRPHRRRERMSVQVRGSEAIGRHMRRVCMSTWEHMKGGCASERSLWTWWLLLL